MKAGKGPRSTTPRPGDFDPARSFAEALAPPPPAANDTRVDATAATAPRLKRDAGVEVPLESRVRAFMLIRIAVLSCFGLLAAITRYLPSATSDVDFSYSTWSLFGIIYGLAVLGAWIPFRYTGQQRFLQLQTGVDILLAAIVVQHTGGADSGFSILYLIAILGAAVTGSKLHCWATAGSCALIYVTMTGLQATGLVSPLQASGEPVTLSATQLTLAAARSLGSIAAVGLLASQLNAQWRQSQHIVGNLRALNENILQSMTSGMIVVDHDGIIRYSNPTAESILVPAGDWLGRPVDEYMPRARQKILERSEGHLLGTRFEIDVDGPDRHELHLGLSCCPLRDENGRVMGHIVNFQDVTELRLLERRMRHNERMAAVGELAATVAHEVRNPLAAMAGCAQLLDDPRLDEEQRRLIAVIRREAQRLEHTVQELLLFTRPQGLRTENVDVRDITQQVVESFREDPNNVDVQIEVNAPQPAQVAIDRAQFAQVLWNLLRNAREAQVQRPRIDLDIEARTETARLSVRDYGSGIPAGRLHKVFEPNYTTKTGGNGFGLALAASVVDMHGGTIEAKSLPETGGALFIVELPLVHTSNDQGPTDDATHAA